MVLIEFPDENRIINDNIRLVMKEFINATTLKREDIIAKLINQPIRWCGIVSEVNENNIILNNESVSGYFIFSNLSIPQQHRPIPFIRRLLNFPL
jgi:hypothetical protein